MINNPQVLLCLTSVAIPYKFYYTSQVLLCLINVAMPKKCCHASQVTKTLITALISTFSDILVESTTVNTLITTHSIL